MRALPIDSRTRPHFNSHMNLQEAQKRFARHTDMYRRAYLILIRDTDLPFFDRVREVFDLVT